MTHNTQESLESLALKPPMVPSTRTTLQVSDPHAHLSTVCLHHMYAQMRTPEPHSPVLPEEHSWLQVRRPKVPSPSYHHPNCVILGKSTNLSGMCISKMMMPVSHVCFNENQSLEAKRKDCAQIKATGKGIDTSCVGWVHWRRTRDACSKIPSKESAASGPQSESQELG